MTITITAFERSPDGGKGLARGMIQEIADEAYEAGADYLTLTCYLNNPRARHIYDDMDFKYKTIPQYREHNAGMSLDEFKTMELFNPDRSWTPVPDEDE